MDYQKLGHAIAESERRSLIFSVFGRFYKSIISIEILLMLICGTIFIGTHLDVGFFRSFLISIIIVALMFMNSIIQLIVWLVFSVFIGIGFGLLTYNIVGDDVSAVIIGIFATIAAVIIHYAGWKYIEDEFSGLTGFIFD